MNSGLQVLDYSLCQWNLELWIPIFSGIPDSGFRIPNSRIPYYTRQIFSDSGFHKKKILEGAHVQRNNPALAAGHLTELSEIIKQLV